MKYRMMCFLIITFAGCENFIDIGAETKVMIKFKNNSSYDLNNLLVAEKTIGFLPAGAVSKYYSFNSFTFDTGMPDENASALIDGRIITNHYRNYWCGTEKITIDNGKYLVYIEVLDTMLYLGCENAPTIFDP